MSTHTFLYYRKRFLDSVFIALLGIIFFFSVSELAVSQQKPLSEGEKLFAQLASTQEKTDESLLSIEFSNISIQEALEILAKKANVGFSYNPDTIPDKRINLIMTSVPPHEVIYKLLEGTNLEPVLPPSKDVIVIREKAPFHAADAFQQTISGTVVDSETGEVLPGVNVIANVESMDSPTGTTTNMDGEYEIEVPDEVDTLVFSYIGYQRLEVPINGRTEIDVEMSKDIQMFDDVVVVGYGTIQREQLTSSVSRVSSEDFVQGAALDPAQLIRGMIPGLTISRTGANPTESSSLMLRGTGTLIGDASPLVIIDGIEGSLSDVSTGDIESVNVIKDASASAIYGTRGSNGVVIIETKRAERGVLAMQYDSYVSTQQVTDKIPVFSADEYRNIEMDGIDVIDFGHSNDWQDLAYRDTPISHEHNLILSSGVGDIRYIATLNYKNFEGLVNRSDNNVINARLRVDHSIFDGQLDLSGTVNLQNKWHFQGAQGGSFNNRVVNNITAFNPTRPIFNEDGSYNDSGDNNHENPISIIEEANGQFQETQANFHGSAEYYPIRELRIRAQASRFTTDGLTGYAQSKDHVIDIRNGLNGYASRASNKSIESTVDVLAEYSSSFQGHNVNVLGGYSWKEDIQEGFFANNWDFPSDVVAYNSLSDGLAQARGETTTSSFKQKSNLIGYFSRINYNYDNRYMLMASMRREGSSKFGTENQWGNFPAFSAGWNISSERFMQDVDFLDGLKLRFGFGRTGTSPVNPYLSLSRLSFGARFFSNGEWISTIQPLNNPNPDLKWETREELNLGVDFAVLNNRINGSVDVYHRETKDLLFNFTVPTPPFLFSSILANAGTIENQGLEVNLNLFPVDREDLQWNSTVNYSTNRNELTSLSSDQYSIGEGGFFDAGSTGAPIQQQTHRVQVGRAIGNFYAFETVGVTDDGMWEIIGEDGQRKSIADQIPEDKRVVGNGIPDHHLSWINKINYRNWDFEILMRGAFGFQVANMRGMFFGVPTVLRQMNALTSTIEPKYGDRPLSPDQSEQYVSHFIEDGDFWKIDNITLGHTFDVGADSIIRNARVYISGNNLITITGYSGFDPEVNFSGLTPGMDHIFRFPSTRTYTLGVSVRF